MKNLKLNTGKILVTILMLFSCITFAQSTYLKITKSDSTSISYPPETKFELKNQHGYIILKNNNTPTTFKIEESYTLLVYPSYKSEIDTFKLNKGKIELVEAKQYKESSHTYGTYASNGVSADFVVTKSKKLENTNNISFKLSNGITFNYTDGKVNAYLNEEENYLNIEGQYVINSDLGKLKISFNPKNGETWWVFEPKK